MSFEQNKKANVQTMLIKKGAYKKINAIGARIVNNLTFRKRFYAFYIKKSPSPLSNKGTQRFLG
jgi:hypothetical protein